LLSHKSKVDNVQKELIHIIITKLVKFIYVIFKTIISSLISTRMSAQTLLAAPHVGIT